MEGENRRTIGELIDLEVIKVHKDGNHGSNYPRGHEFGDEGVLFLTAKVVSDSGRIDFDSAPRLNEAKAKQITFGYLETDDVLLSHNATVGRVAVVPELTERVLIGTSLTHFRLDKDVLLPRYLAAFFSGRDFQNQLAAFMSLSTRNQVPITTQRKLYVDVPPIPEQRAIARILGTLDDKIELNHRVNETLESMARALFKSWFVDFDPVIDNALAADNPIPEPLQARAETRLALGNKRKPLPKKIQKLFPDSFVFDKEMGWIPDRWKIPELEELCETITDGAHRSPPSVDDGLPMASVKDMHNWGFTLDGCRQISKDEFAKLIESGCQPKRGDVLLAKDGAKCLETVCEFQQNDEIVLLSSVAIFRPKLATLSPFLHIWFGLDSTQFYLKEGFVSGSAIPRAVLRDLKKARLLCPTEGILEAFADMVNPTRNRVWSTIEQSSMLSATRDTLLPKLLSGELRIPDAEKLVANTIGESNA